LKRSCRLLCATAWVLVTTAMAQDRSNGSDPATQLLGVTVTAQRLDLLGTAQTASDGVVSREELQLAPAYRPGQLLETVPGLIVTLHSGEGKANQYLMRGYNLDHGTDLATFIDGVPVNQPTHAHGQGYTDLNILIPELLGGLSYTKGTYHAWTRFPTRPRLPPACSGSSGCLAAARGRLRAAPCSARWSCSTTTAPSTCRTISARRTPCCAIAAATSATAGP
jgi:hypothetical protein